MLRNMFNLANNIVGRRLVCVQAYKSIPDHLLVQPLLVLTQYPANRNVSESDAQFIKIF